MHMPFRGSKLTQARSLLAPFDPNRNPRKGALRSLGSPSAKRKSEGTSRRAPQACLALWWEFSGGIRSIYRVC
eukprot:149031-Prorocentrum_minimum.AAC.1